LSAKSVTINKSRIHGFTSTSGGNGINVAPTSANTNVTISDTSLSYNARGVFVQGSGAGSANVMLDHVNISDGAKGLVVMAGSTGRISNSVITSVNAALSGSGEIISFGNNAIAGNVFPANDNPTNTIPLK
jgi:hypothetical protein